MPVGTWDPKKGVEKERRLVSGEDLSRCVSAARQVAESVSPVALAGAGLEPFLMSLDEDAWAAAGSLGSRDLIALVRLFTLAEKQVPGWGAGKNSPVIPLVKFLRKRGEFEPELRKWIRANTDNRYLPYGSAL